MIRSFDFTILCMFSESEVDENPGACVCFFFFFVAVRGALVYKFMVCANDK